MHRKDAYVRTLAEAYDKASQALQDDLSEQAEMTRKQFTAFNTETLQKLDEIRRGLENDSRAMGQEVQKLKVDLEQRSRELKTAMEEWDKHHRQAFQGLDKFQKEYREMIQSMDQITQRMDKVIQGFQNPSLTSILVTFGVSGLGAALAVFIVMHVLYG